MSYQSEGGEMKEPTVGDVFAGRAKRLPGGGVAMDVTLERSTDARVKVARKRVRQYGSVVRREDVVRRRVSLLDRVGMGLMCAAIAACIGAIGLLLAALLGVAGMP